MLGASARQIKGGTVELVGSPGGGGSPGTALWSPSWLLTQNLATWEENGYFFPSALLFWLLFFLFLNPWSSPRRCPSDCLQAAPVWGGPGSSRDAGSLRRGSAPWAQPLLSRPCLCPGLVCEVGMMIAATFQPTSQGCCGDTVISEIVHVVMRREPPTTFSLADPDFASLYPAAPASLLLAFVSLFLLLHQGASLTSAESLEHLTRQLQTHPASHWLGRGASWPPPYYPPVFRLCLPLPVVTNSYLFPLRRLNESNECELHL